MAAVKTKEAGRTKVATRLAHNPASICEARDAVEGLGAVLDEQTVATVKLLVSELVTNSVRHGSPDEDGEIELSVSASPRSVRVEVADSGLGFAPEPRASDHDEGSGWGLHLLDTLSHRWGTDRDAGMRVWFEIDKPSFTAAAAAAA